MQYQDCEFTTGNLDVIRYSNPFSKYVNEGAAFKTPSMVGDFVLMNLHKCASDCNNMRRLCNHARQIKDTPQELPVLSEVSEETAFNHYLPFYCRYKNREFQALVSGVPQHSQGLEELTYQVYDPKLNKTREELHEMTELIFCKQLNTLLDQVFEAAQCKWHVRFNDDFIDQLANVKQEMIPVFCVYLVLVWWGRLVTDEDIYTVMQNRHQPFKINQDFAYAIDFAELIYSKKLLLQPNVNLHSNVYVSGRLLPARFATTQPVKDKDGKVVSGEYELVELKHYQFISLDAIHFFEAPHRTVQIIVEKEHETRKGGKYVDTKTYTQQVHFHRKWDDFKLVSDTSAEYSALFARSNISSDVFGQHDSIRSKNTQFRYNVQFYQERNHELIFMNTRMKDRKVSTQPLNTYYLCPDSQQWVSDFEGTLDIANIYEPNTTVSVSDERIITKLSSGKQNKNLLEILRKMPNLDLTLSEQQEEVVTSTTNMLCLGRSGTGKTTSSVLRLFSQQIMFILLRKQELLKAKLGDQYTSMKDKKLRLTSQDLQQPVGMKSVFISASPVLVNEVQRFYNRLKDALIIHLQNKEAQEAAEFVQEESDSTEGQSVQKEHDNILQLATYEAELIEEELAAQQQLDIPAAFEDLQPEHFPLFVTVKQLLYMIDASLNYSFFARDHQNRMLGLENNLSWHNENKGMFMINSQYKSNQDFDQLLQEYGEMLINEEETDLTTEMEDHKLTQNDEKRQTTKITNRYWNNRYTALELEVAVQNQHTRRYNHGQVLSFEVDFEIFETQFMPRYNRRKSKQKDRLSAATLWTEIFSVIKGGLDVHRVYMGSFRAREYIRDRASGFLSKAERQCVYAIYLEYERWKQERNAFDLMDLVQYIFNSSKVTSSWYGQSMRMDFLMIDEVQDLSPSTMQLLLQLTKQKVYFAGDTAQTIAKGVGARFSDLRTLIQNFDCKIVQLTTNYRSHGKILSLANSVVELLEVLFPFSIDSLVREQSMTDGLKPLILQPMSLFSLKKYFMGQQNKHVNVQVSHGFSKPQFGCNQCVIVRDQQHKDRLPEFLQNMLVLTVYEAKGLEFDDVILFNFFNSQEIANFKWKLINDIQFEDLSEEDLSSLAQQLEQSVINANEQDKDMYHSRKTQIHDHKNKTKLIAATKNRSHVYRKYSALCIELKMLYVAITRPKKRLIIYDEDNQNRIPIQRVWDHLKLVDIVSDQMILEDKHPEHLKSLFAADGGLLGTTKSTDQEWKVQGIKFFKKKQFDQAYKCFQFADEAKLATKCLAYQLADEAQSKLAEIQPLQFKIDHKYAQSKFKAERKQLTKEIQNIRSQARKLFERAGDNFYQSGNKQQAASCYFTSNRFSKASQVFEEIGQFAQAAECTMRQSKTKGEALLKAAEMFLKGNLVARAIECYERLEAWESLLLAIYKSRKDFKPAEWEALYNKYVPIALNKLYLLMMGEEQVQESNQGVVAELKVKQKYEKEDAIQEADEEYFSEESDSSSGEQPALVQDEVQTSEAENEEESSEEDQGIEILDEVFDLTQKKKQRQEQLLQQQQAEEEEIKPAEEREAKEEVDSNEASFEIVSNSPSQEAEPDSNLPNRQQLFDHVSSYDPDDENLQSEHSFLLINSILSGQDCEEQSEFSIVDDSNQSFVIVDDSQSSHSVISFTSSALSKGSLRLIRSQRKVADAVIRKIIFYISLFSDEVKERLRNLHRKLPAEIQPDDIDLKLIDRSFVEVMLGILEKFDLIKLCFILCNKFKFFERVGAYTVSACLKYQSLQQIRFAVNLDQVRIESSIVRTRNRQRSLIAHEAIHNVFSLISSDLLRLKGYGEALTAENSLGMHNCRMIFMLGFWKKLVYTMSLSNGIDLAYRMADTHNHEVLIERLEELGDDPKPELHAAQKLMVYLKQANFIISKHAYVFWRGQKNPTFYEEFLANTKDELQLSQLEDKPFVKDLFTLVKYLLVPDRAKGLRDQQGPVLKINLIDKQKAQDSEELRMVRFEAMRQEVIEAGKEVFSRRFHEVATHKQDQLVQKFLAFVFSSYMCRASNLTTLIKTDHHSYQNLMSICSQMSLKNPVSREAIFACSNVQSLDTSDFMTGAQKVDPSDLFQPFAQNYILVNQWSPLMGQFLWIQQRARCYERDCIFIQKCIDTLRQSWQHKDFLDVDMQKLAQSKELMDINFDLFFDMMARNHNTETQAYVVDMDLQFALVPISWATNLINMKVAQLQNQLFAVWQSNYEQTMMVSNKSGLALMSNYANYLRLFDSKAKVPDSIVGQITGQHKVWIQELVQKQPSRYQNILKHSQFNSYLKSLKIDSIHLPKSVAQQYQHTRTFNDFFHKVSVETHMKKVGSLLSEKFVLSSELKPLVTMSVQAIHTQVKLLKNWTFDQCVTLFCSQLAGALNLMHGCDQTYLFVAEALSKLRFDSTLLKQEREVLTGFKQQAYAMIAFDHWELHKAVQLQFESYCKLSPHASQFYSVEILKKVFYTLLAAMTKDCFIPLSNLHYIDSTVDLSALEQAALLASCDEDDYGDEGYYEQQIEDDEEYYDETDRPSAQDVRKDNIQMVKQKSLNKKMSSVQGRQVITHNISGVQWKVDYQRAQKQLRQVLKMIHNEVRYQNEEQTGNFELLLEIFNMVVALAVNLGFKNYSKELTDCFDALELSSASQDMYAQLLKYVQQPSEIPDLWVTSKDTEKYAFFTRTDYIVNLKMESAKDLKAKVDYDRKEAVLASKRLDAIKTLKRRLKPALVNFRQHQKLLQLAPLIQLFDIDPAIYKIKQVLPNLKPLLGALQDIENRLHSLDHICLSIQQTVPSHQLKAFQQASLAYSQLKSSLVQTLNGFITDKAAILNEFQDEGDVDSELKLATTKALSRIECVDARLQTQTKLTLLRGEAIAKSEDEIQRGKRIRIKWQQMNMLKLRQQKLKAKIFKAK